MTNDEQIFHSLVNVTISTRNVANTLTPYVSDEARTLFAWIVYGGTLVLLTSFGIATNIINIICFLKQGVKDSITVSLLGLATSDLGCLVTTLTVSIAFIPAFQRSDMTFDPIQVFYLSSGLPHIAFSGCTSWFTALITLERCLCITMPLKVNRIMTPRRITIIMVCIYALIFSSVCSNYHASKLGMRFSPERNATILGLVSTKDRAIVDQISFAINNAIIPFCAYSTIMVCTITLVVKLHEKRKWRLKSTASVSSDTKSERDVKVARMVVMISTLFICCFSPMCCMFISMIVVPGLAVDGPYSNTLYVLVGVSATLEAVNSSSNIFIYYHMSTKYKTVFRMVLCKDKQIQICRCLSSGENEA